jgi:hypothetical protein
MSPKKMIRLLFAAAAAKLYEVFGQAGVPHPRMRDVLAYLNKLRTPSMCNWEKNEKPHSKFGSSMVSLYYSERKEREGS